MLLVLRLRAIWNKDLIGTRAYTCADEFIRSHFDFSHTDSIFNDGRYVLHNFISNQSR